MKSIFIFSFFIFISSGIFAQSESEIEQLKNELISSSDSRRLEILKVLTEYYSDTLSDLALGYAAQYLKLSQLYHSKKDEANAHSLLGTINFYRVDNRKAVDNHKKAVAIYKELNDENLVAIHQFKVSTNLLHLHIFDSSKIYNDSVLARYRMLNDKAGILSTKIQLGKIYNLSFRNNSAVIVFNEVLQIPDLTLDLKAWAMHWLGNSYYKLGDFANAEKILQASVECYEQEKNIQGKLGSLQLLGEIYLTKGQYADAYNLFFMSYQNQQYVKGDLSRIQFSGQYFINMGNVFFNTGDYKTTVQYFDSALAIGERYRFTAILSKAYEYLGQTYAQQNKYDLAFKNFETALEINKTGKNRMGEAAVLNQKGNVYFSQGKTDLALESYKLALEINEKIGNIFGKATNHHHLAVCYLKKEQFDKAKQHLDLGIPFARQAGVDELIQKYYQSYISHCNINGNHDKGHNYFNLYLALSEKISQSNLRNLTDLLLKFYENSQSNERKMFDTELEIKNLEAEKNRFNFKQLVYISIIIVAITLVIILLYINKFLTARKLEKIIDERTKTLRENELKLIETNKTQDRLYSIIAHDLKSPFNSLIGFANLLEEEYDDFTDEDRKKYIGIMRNSSEEVFTLLENLLEWTRNSLEDIQYKPIRFDLNKTIKQSISLVEKNATLKNISITNDSAKNTFVFADENMVKTIVRNLLSNAIKFTNPGGGININCNQRNGFIECSVSDTGIGIPQEHLGKLFNIENTIKKKGTANERGTGLGLALCKEFVEKNGGNISVESELENLSASKTGGSKFVFTLPVK